MRPHFRDVTHAETGVELTLRYRGKITFQTWDTYRRIGCDVLMLGHDVSDHTLPCCRCPSSRVSPAV